MVSSESPTTQNNMMTEMQPPRVAHRLTQCISLWCGLVARHPPPEQRIKDRCPSSSDESYQCLNSFLAVTGKFPFTTGTFLYGFGSRERHSKLKHRDVHPTETHTKRRHSYSLTFLSTGYPPAPPSPTPPPPPAPLQKIWHTKLFDTRTVTQLNLLRRESVNIHYCAGYPAGGLAL